MTFDTATGLYDAISQSTRKDALLTRLFDELVLAAVKYARLRVDWQLASLEERTDMDARRTRAHNAFMDSCNILSRAMVKNALGVEWRAELGTDRKEIGDFACHIHCLLGIRAR